MKALLMTLSIVLFFIFTPYYLGVLCNYILGPAYRPTIQQEVMGVYNYCVGMGTLLIIVSGSMLVAEIHNWFKACVVTRHTNKRC